MIILLEGVNGVGKTTYARRLAEKLELKVYRAMRSDDDENHWGVSDKHWNELQERLAKAEVPINTHVDDLFVADFMAAFEPSVILDRGLYSAIAYGETYHQPFSRYESDIKEWIIRFWESRMKKAGAFLVHMTASYEAAKERCEGRFCPNKQEYHRLQNVFDKLFRRSNLTKMAVNTEKVKLEDGVDWVIRATS